jgi:hypothetical protein
VVASTLATALSGCDSIGSLAVSAGDFAGAKSDVHCDRRFVTDGGQPASFCQELLTTVAASEFSDDCRAKHLASAAPGPCPRDRRIAGCRLRKHNDDDSTVFDWYYDVSDIVADAGPNAGPDGGPTFEDPAVSVQDVTELCADPSRYEEGADLVLP